MSRTVPRTVQGLEKIGFNVTVAEYSDGVNNHVVLMGNETTDMCAVLTIIGSGVETLLTGSLSEAEREFSAGVTRSLRACNGW